MNNTALQLMEEATRLTRSGQLQEATAAIQRALAQAVPARDRAQPAAAAQAPAEVLDGLVFESGLHRGADTVEPPRAEPGPARGAGVFAGGSHSQAGLTRAYKLYAPPGATGQALPLVVMLHGCTQNPDDFAAGTSMNEHAREQGFFVLYPAQAQDANPSRCWNWFKHSHQQRGRGEPALLAGMTQAVMQQHGIDPRRVYIAGLSAGGAMAAIVAAAYPELFAAVGVHSGLARGAAGNLSEALAAMQGGGRGHGGLPNAVPTIVFHGDQDRTVHPRNGEQVIAAVRGGAAAGATVEQGVCGQGRRYTRSAHPPGSGSASAEHWLVHGGGHAWSGGQAAGSYTDAKGPDASREMLRFFFAHPQPSRH